MAVERESVFSCRVCGKDQCPGRSDVGYHLRQSHDVKVAAAHEHYRSGGEFRAAEEFRTIPTGGSRTVTYQPGEVIPPALAVDFVRRDVAITLVPNVEGV